MIVRLGAVPRGRAAGKRLDRDTGGVANDQSRAGRRVWHRFANTLVLCYLAAGVIAGVLHVRGEAPEWLVIHLLLLGAVTNAIVVWSSHFATTLLAPAHRPERLRASSLLVLNVGIVCVLAGVTSDLFAVTVIGAALATLVIGANGFAIARAVCAARAGRFASTVRFYAVAAVAVVFGIAAGTALVRGVPPTWYARVFAAHVHLNVFGWVALTVLGTEFGMWPMVLRTRMAEGVETAARHTLALCATALALTTLGLLAGTRFVVIAGLAVYLAGTARSLEPFVRTALQRPPHSPAAWMLAAATSWLFIAVASDFAMACYYRDINAYAYHLDGVVPWMITGFVLQMLGGALTYLIPVVVGGGPMGGRRIASILDRWGATRAAAFNAGVVLIALPLPHAETVAGWWLVGVALATFVVLAAVGLLTASRRAPD